MITEIRALAGHLPHVSCKVDGIPCDMRKWDGGIVVMEQRHPSRIVLRGSELPSDLLEAYRECLRQAKHNGQSTAEENEKFAGCRTSFADPHFLSKE